MTTKYLKNSLISSHSPILANHTWVAPSAIVIGATTLLEHSSVWFQAVIRADINNINIGQYSNIQDGSILHVSDSFPCIIGNFVSIGHRAIVHACTVHDRVLIGMGSIIMDGAIIHSDSIIGAGSLVTKDQIIPAGSLVMGSPAKVIRSLNNSEINSITHLAYKYAELASLYPKTN
jgi:carbonic anhydrase/acetyltransferase-like protein (isoleucine patch superfamily)